MSLLVTGTIALDTVETPHGTAESVLGGSSVYFSLAASCFTDVRLVGIVGDDFDRALLDPLRVRNIDTRGIEIRADSKTFRWRARYTGSMNDAETIDTQLNVLGEKAPQIPPEFLDSEYIFLANAPPATQLDFAKRFPGACLIVCDTMNLWIETEPDALKQTLAAVHGLVLNENEARLLTECQNLITAGRRILEMGPRFVVIKKGEHGSLLVSHEDLFVLPAYPTEKTIDPTGCGDTFAGGMMGYLASRGELTPAALRSAMARGSVVASFVIESFSIDALARINRDDIEQRLKTLRQMSVYE